MKKKIIKYDDEIDLTKIISTFWEKKTTMILIILVSVIIGIAIDMTAEKKKDLYEGTLLISESSNSEFTIFYPINKYLNKFDVKKNKIQVLFIMIIFLL